MRYTKNIFQLRQAKKQWLKHNTQQEHLLHKAEDLSDTVASTGSITKIK